MIKGYLPPLPGAQQVEGCGEWWVGGAYPGHILFHISHFHPPAGPLPDLSWSWLVLPSSGWHQKLKHHYCFLVSALQAGDFCQSKAWKSSSHGVEVSNENELLLLPALRQQKLHCHCYLFPLILQGLHTVVSFFNCLFCTCV